MTESSNAGNTSVPPNGQLPLVRNMVEWFKKYLRHVGTIAIPQPSPQTQTPKSKNG